MIRCTPRYTVSYRGVFHKAGESFEIDGADREEMARHGNIEGTGEVRGDFEETAPPETPLEEPEGPKSSRKVGRPRKEVANG